jgi:glycogen phosphorylase
MLTTESRIPYLPARIEGLSSIVMNLWWSWSREARTLFHSIDPLLWHRARHNPIDFLCQVDPARMAACASDTSFLRRYDEVMARMTNALTTPDTWFSRTYPGYSDGPLAYFCAEFGLHASVPIYSGGLGVLAGDHCKSASDFGVPMIGVGLLYMKGYFDQRLRLDGWQEDSDEEYDVARTPLEPVVGPNHEPFLATVATAGRPVQVRAWRIMVGRVPIYLLDTNLETNHPEDRLLMNKLYAGGPELRLRQEWILGAGGVRMLRAVGIQPAVWHANEGHAAFMMVERIRELASRGAPFADAVREVRARSIFTTHTPVPAGHDAFAAGDVAACIGPVWDEMGVDQDTFFRLGRHPAEAERFHMTVAAMRCSSRVNAVSRQHGQVSRHLWRDLWPNRPWETIPVGHITNGVHLPTWMAASIMSLLDQHLGPGWTDREEDPALWDQVLTLDHGQLWEVHLKLKGVLHDYIREDTRHRFAGQHKEAAQVVGAGTLLEPNALTIGFARRFATYKRPNLIFRDLDRLRRLLTNPRRPVQIVFAGKAHPADNPGKEVLQSVYQFTRDPAFEGRVAFIEDYDMHLAHLLVQGTDLWLNLPRIPLEASGTSGMKAGLNGVPQLGTLDGWWKEAYDGLAGWAIPQPGEQEDADEADAARFYSLLEEQVIPLYYNRDARGVPLGWVEKMRYAIRLGGTRFTARRMMQEYVQKYYAPAFRGDSAADDPPTG